MIDKMIEHLEEVTIRFADDLLYGMQPVGTHFSNTSGFAGNEVKTFPETTILFKTHALIVYEMSALLTIG